MKTICYRNALAIGAAIFCVESFAGNAIDDTHVFHLGYARQDADVKVTSSVDPLPPIEIDLQDDLNSDTSSESVLAAYHWRFAQRWVLGITYQSLKLSGGGAAARDFNFDGTEYRAGAQVDSTFEMDTYRLDVAYAVIHNDRWEVLLGAGIHTFAIDTSISAEIAVAGGAEEAPIISQRQSESANVLAPLPNVRGAVHYLITPRWSVRGSAGWLGLDVDDFSGAYTYADVSTDYRITEHFGIGASYQVFTFDAKISDSEGFDEVDIALSGPSIYLVYGF